MSINLAYIQLLFFKKINNNNTTTTTTTYNFITMEEGEPSDD